MNDFTALAMGLPYLTRQQFRQVGGGTARERSVIGLIGAGTGLGVSGLIPADDGWVSLASEGGHIGFAPQNAREMTKGSYPPRASNSSTRRLPRSESGLPKRSRLRRSRSEA